MSYDPKKIEPKWQKYWEEHPELCMADGKSEKEKKYILDMFPYPSGAGLHIGHVESYTATDIISRYYRMNGKNVLHPQGWDAFGLPAENYAIKTGTHPDITTHENIKNFTKQIKSLGMSYDWSREVDTSDPGYYKWTQWFFLMLYKNGLAYKKKAHVNWCSSCQTVLANEQVVDGKCERCGTSVMQKELEQWFFKITDFIEDDENTAGLISGLEKVDWPESTKAAQRNWIGRSEGATVKFQVANSQDFIEVFTTRVDTIFGCTYCVVAPEHPIIENYKLQITNYKEVEGYIEATKKKSDLDRMEAKEKTGVILKGMSVINPFNKEEVPLFVADYVLGQYGTGAVMAVPAHDERDYEFAKKYDLPIRQSVAPHFIDQHNPPVDGKKTVSRRAVQCIIRHWNEDKFITLHWKKHNWKTFIIGGIENEEDEIEAGIREIKEETGYKNLKFVRKIGGEFISEYFAAHKDENRYGIFQGLYFELENGEKDEIANEEMEKHEVVWTESDKVREKLSSEDIKIMWDSLIEGERAFTCDGTVINSGEFSHLKSQEAREKMTQWLEKEELGSRKVNYKLRDWLVSRQRYWGAPIPIIYCDKCGTVPVPEEDLPVKLPTDVDFKPTGESPLVYSESFHDVKCPICGERARRESDTMDTFVCSSWYYFRYSDPKNEKEFASKENIKKWLPVDIYVGGAEHSVLHLLYARFFTKALHKLGYIEFDEPFLKLRHQGIILAEDGRKMSKSLGNVVNPDDIVAEVGADVLRMYEMFMGPLETMKPWSTSGISGIVRFLEKVHKLQSRIDTNDTRIDTNSRVTSFLHKTIKKVTDDIENFRFNTAISALMIFVNELDKQEQIRIADYKLLITLLAPFAPHIAEELWSSFAEATADEKKMGSKESIFLSQWPEYNEELAKDEEVEMVVQVNGKVRERLMVVADVTEDEIRETALENEKVKVFTDGKEIRKIIFVPGRLINIVVN